MPKDLAEPRAPEVHSTSETAVQVEIKNADRHKVGVCRADGIGQLVQVRHHLMIDPAVSKDLAEPRAPFDREITFILNHVNQQLHRGGATDRKHILHCLNDAIRALPKNKTSEEVEPAADGRPRALGASTRDEALRVERVQMRRQTQTNIATGRSLCRADALWEASMTSEEALQQAQAQGLTLRVGEGKTGYVGVRLDDRLFYRRWPYMAVNSSDGHIGVFATAEEAALRVAQAAARRAARTAELTSRDERLAQQLAQRKAQRLAPRGKRKAAASLKEEEVIPPMPSDAIVKEELMVAPTHLDAIVKEEGISVPPMPPDAFVKHEVLKHEVA